jgi:hypothetical protein
MDAHQPLADIDAVRLSRYTNVTTTGGLLVRSFVAYAEAASRGARTDICADLPGHEQPDDRIPASQRLRDAARAYARSARLRGDSATRMIVDVKALLSPAVPMTRRVTLSGDLVSRVVSWSIEAFYTEGDD